MSPDQMMHLAVGSLVPAAVAGIVFLLLDFWRASMKEPWIRLMAALAAAVIYGFTVGVLIAPPAWPPGSSHDWLTWGAGIALVCALGAAWPHRQGIAVFTAGAAGAVILARLTAGAALRGAWSGTDTLLHLGSAGLLAGVMGASVLAIGQRSALLGISVLLLSLIGASQVLVLGMYSLKLGQCAGVLAAMVGATLVIAALRGQHALGSPLITVVVVLLAGIVFQGAEYGEVSLERGTLLALLITAGPALGAAVLISPLGRLTGWRKWAITLAAAAAPVGIAVALSALSYEGAS